MGKLFVKSAVSKSIFRHLSKRAETLVRRDQHFLCSAFPVIPPCRIIKFGATFYQNDIWREKLTAVKQTERICKGKSVQTGMKHLLINDERLSLLV